MTVYAREPQRPELQTKDIVKCLELWLFTRGVFISRILLRNILYFGPLFKCFIVAVEYHLSLFCNTLPSFFLLGLSQEQERLPRFAYQCCSVLTFRYLSKVVGMCRLGRLRVGVLI